MKIENPYHEGELQVQRHLGVLDEGAMNSRVIQNSIINGALRFINQLPMVVFGSLDQEQNVWASVFIGKPGFMEAEDERTVTFDLSRMMHNPFDPFWENIQKNSQVGMLAIELASRRRLRINGTITRISDTALRLHVEESYPNCPKYIQKRHLTLSLTGFDLAPSSSEQGKGLGLNQHTLITKADTFFVASVHPGTGCGCLAPWRPPRVREDCRRPDPSHPRLRRQLHVQHPGQFYGESPRRTDLSRFRIRSHASSDWPTGDSL